MAGGAGAQRARFQPRCPGATCRAGSGMLRKPSNSSDVRPGPDRELCSNNPAGGACRGKTASPDVKYRCHLVHFGFCEFGSLVLPTSVCASPPVVFCGAAESQLPFTTVLSSVCVILALGSFSLQETVSAATREVLGQCSTRFHILKSASESWHDAYLNQTLNGMYLPAAVLDSNLEQSY